MKLTRYTDYSLRVLLHLAALPGGVSSIAEIARVHRVSENHLMKVVHELGRAGFLKTTRGRGGGVALARPAEIIRVGDVVRRTEGDCALVDCTGCALAPGCRLTGLLGEARRAFYAVLDAQTIGDLVGRAGPPLNLPPHAGGEARP
jgi:Rrf2 family transcriptional regulator, nitric oxide-sensitive transcriptional repressor